jgi:hypothetical protein
VHHFKTWRLRPTKYETTLNLKTEGDAPPMPLARADEVIE